MSILQDFKSSVKFLEVDLVSYDTRDKVVKDDFAYKIFSSMDGHSLCI